MEKTYKDQIKGKTILITGGTGSFGNSVTGKLLSFAPKKIIILSRDEKKQFDMRNKFNNPLLQFVIGDVRDKDSFHRFFEGVDYVFHAAALKQVPTCEFFPIEAVKTNILGAHNVIETAITYKIKRLVILSTDKAVYPINAMGMTKALMEKTMIAAARQMKENKAAKTVLCGVRYGNVLYSRGSVLPYFVDLMRENKTLQVTNSQMTRFLLSLEKAVDLVLYAMTNGKNGDMYVRKAPSATIETLAKAMCMLFNYKKGYEEVGVRAGEKMHETLVSQEEMFRSEDETNYFRIPSESQGLDYNKYFKRGKKSSLESFSAYTSANTNRLGVTETVTLLKTIPEIKEDLKNFKK